MKKSQRAICIVLSIVMLLSLLPVSIYAESEDYATGLIWDDWDSLGKKAESGYIDDGYLPSSVDLTDLFPSPGDQGSQNSCAAWAVGYALVSYQQNIKRGWTKDTDEHLFSPSYIYNQINGGVDGGSTISDCLDVVTQQGICTLSYFSYNENDHTT